MLKTLLSRFPKKRGIFSTITFIKGHPQAYLFDNTSIFPFEKYVITVSFIYTVYTGEAGHNNSRYRPGYNTGNNT